ncbi:hypothetical protein BsWGS_25176 [Bradybaena similaris]
MVANTARVFSTWAAVLPLGFVLLGSSVGDTWDYNIKDYKDHPCYRTCQDQELPRVCRYDFLVENYYVLPRACRQCPFNQSDCLLPHCVPADGFRRAIKVVNRMLPGPIIQVCQGDTIEVTVKNSLSSGEGTSIHWHGILQQGTPHMDGVSSVTQCPITYNSHFTYKFVASDFGTHFWHGHSGVQRADGLFGPLIIRQASSQDVHSSMYQHDLPEHIITVTDWLTKTTTERMAEYMHFDQRIYPRLMLINGMGRYQAYRLPNNTAFYTPYATFSVERGHKYRFRVINAGINNCAIQFSIDDHNLTVIASDGQPLQPFTTDSFNIYAGERYDFVLHANSVLGNYWIRLRGYGMCEPNRLTQTAILRYQGAAAALPRGTTTWWDGIRAGTNLNSAKDTGNTRNVEITDLQSTDADDNTSTAQPNKKYFLAIDFVRVENLQAYNPRLYPFGSTTGSSNFSSPQINWISSHLPSSPPLTQLKDLPEEIFCNAETVQQQCKKEWCACVHLYKVALGDLVELIVVDEGTLSHAYHPMHLHGHKFRVVGMGKLNESTSLEKVKEMDRNGQLNRTRSKAPIKDTVIVPDGGYTIIRFKADNPGFWLFHCHVEFHSEAGMAMVFQVGELSEHPPTPRNFPSCGHWRPTD